MSSASYDGYRIEIGPKTKERFERVKQKIQEEPKRFVMETYFLDTIATDQLPEWYKEPACGTTACICGWANLIRMADENNPLLAKLGTDTTLSFLHRMWTEAADYPRGLRWLDIQEKYHGEVSVSDRIFHVANWPEKYQSLYEKAKTARQAVKAACEYIDYLCSGPVRKTPKVLPED